MIEIDEQVSTRDLDIVRIQESWEKEGTYSIGEMYSILCMAVVISP